MAALCLWPSLTFVVTFFAGTAVLHDFVDVGDVLSRQLASNRGAKTRGHEESSKPIAGQHYDHQYGESDSLYRLRRDRDSAKHVIAENEKHRRVEIHKHGSALTEDDLMAHATKYTKDGKYTSANKGKRSVHDTLKLVTSRIRHRGSQSESPAHRKSFMDSLQNTFKGVSERVHEAASKGLAGLQSLKEKVMDSLKAAKSDNASANATHPSTPSAPVHTHGSKKYIPAIKDESPILPIEPIAPIKHIDPIAEIDGGDEAGQSGDKRSQSLVKTDAADGAPAHGRHKRFAPSWSDTRTNWSAYLA